MRVKFLLFLFVITGLNLVKAQTVRTFAGSGVDGTADGVSIAASFGNYISGLAKDAAGNIYVVDYYNHKIRKITPAGIVTTLAGSGSLGSADGMGIAASFNFPTGIVLDAAGNIYITDSGNHKIRKITPGGVVSTFAGSGDWRPLGDDGLGTSASFDNPKGITIDASGNLYVADMMNRKIRKITPAGMVTTLAGNTKLMGSTDGQGATVSFSEPQGIAVDASGNVFMTDASIHKVRKITPTGVVSTFAGSGNMGSADGAGTSASFNNPRNITIDASGNLYIADLGNNKIRKITPSGVVSTYAGTGISGDADLGIASATFKAVGGLLFDASGVMYIGDARKVRRVVKLTPQTISGHINISKVATTAPFNLTATASSGLDITYTSSNPSVATVAGNTVTIVGVGSTIITASQLGSNTYEEAATVTATLTVTKASQTISGLTDMTKLSNVNSFELSAVSSSGLPVSYTSSNLSVASISGSKVIIWGIGTAVITASQGGNDIYLPAANISANLTIKASGLSQEISGLNQMDKLTTDLPFDLTATASSGLPLTYTSSNPAVAIISGNKVTIVGVGRTRITATQTGNETFTSVSTSAELFVTKVAQSISGLSNINKTTIEAPFSLSATASSGLAVNYTSSDTRVATISGSTVTIVGAGSVSITASQAGNGTYNAAANVIAYLNVNKATQTISGLSNLDKMLTDASFSLNATASSGLPVTYGLSNTSVARISGNVITIIGPGTVTITASQAGNSIYEAAWTVSAVLTVGGGGANTTQILSYLYDMNRLTTTPPFALDVTATSGLPVSFVSSNSAVATISGNILTIVGAGTTTITASQAGNDKYMPAPSQTATLTVTKAKQYIEGTLYYPKVASDAPFTLDAVATSGLPLTFTAIHPSVASVSGNTVTILKAGGALFEVTQEGNGIYEPARNEIYVYTTKATQTISGLSNMNKGISDAPFTLTGKSSSGLPLTYSISDPYVASVSGNTITIHGAGEVIITASQSGNDTYKAASEVSVILKIAKGTQTITGLANMTKSLSEERFDLNAKSSSGLDVQYTSSNPSVATIYGNTVTIKGVGSTTISANQDGRHWYYGYMYHEAPTVTATLTVTKGSQSISWLANMNRLITDASFFSLYAEASSGLEVTYTSSNPAVAIIEENVVYVTGPGTAIITASQAGNGMYNAATSVSKTLTVSKIAQSITGLADINKIATDAPFSLNAKSSSGLAVTYTSSNPSVATVSGNNITIVGVGITVITASQVGNSSYLPAESVKVNLTVGKAFQSISGLADINKIATDLPFSLNAEASSGLAVSYASSNPSVATIVGNKVTIVGAGTTVITASQTGNDIYPAAASISATLTVKKASQSLSGITDINKVSTDLPFGLNAKASSSLGVTYTSSSPSVATISGNTVTIKGAGTTIITVSQAGNGIYEAAPSINITMTVEAVTSLNDDIKDTRNVNVFDNGNSAIVIEGEVENINVFDGSGKLIYSGASKQISVSQHGLYVVKIHNKADLLIKKVIIR
ncbi:endoglucanase-like protein [Sporocytophaga myxococcoides]|uniref:Endoglucanase-like protein n=1 Tax=Sporocytophaga myxococcoides TaxID=153721 RepID=A0A098LDX7_9BACT|nr:NHL repeat-containing protein [Sporocytophaga myxococcoides]GAL84278.1 endoglucanase-like protein [Sporocytophaga myxococcoides]